MLSYVQKLRARRNSDEGASAVEYGLLVAAVARDHRPARVRDRRGVRAGFQDTCSALEHPGLDENPGRHGLRQRAPANP
jgi:hypothetical protein